MEIIQIKIENRMKTSNILVKKSKIISSFEEIIFLFVVYICKSYKSIKTICTDNDKGKNERK